MRRDQGVHRDAQLGFPAARDLLHAALEVRRRLEELAPLLQELAPGLGEDGPVAAPIEEVDPQGLLELAHGVSDC